MKKVLAILFLSSLALAGREDRVRENRRTRPFSGAFAYFEAFPASGAGTSGVCSTAAPTGAKGETLTFTRSSSATCTKTASGGLATSGIADGDLVTLSSNVARVEFDADGVRGLLVEAARTNVLLRYVEYANAAWSNVGTPALTGSQTDPFGTSNAVQFHDDDGAAFEGRSQSVTVSAGAAYTAHCYVKAGTLDAARISLDGTVGSSTTLDENWTIISVTDASSSGTSISFQALNGNAAGDTGTVIWGGCQVEAGSDRTSIIPTTSATVTRAVDAASFAPTWPNSASISMAANFYGPTPASGSAAGVMEWNSFLMALNESGGVWRFYNGATFSGITTTISSSTAGVRTYGFHTGTSRGVGWGSNSNSGAESSATNKFGTTLSLGGPSANPPNGIISRVCVDPNATRCR